MREVRIAGVAMTPFGKFMHEPVRGLSETVVRGALDYAGLEASDVGAVYFANALGGILHGQEMIRGQAALRGTGLLGLPMVNVENACASGSTAVHLAWSAVASGATEVALAVGAEKMTHPDKRRPLTAIGSALDLSSAQDVREAINRELLGWDEGRVPHDGTEPAQRSPFIDIYADLARDYMQTSGATVGDFAAVAVKNHRHAENNPIAQYRMQITEHDVLTSREIAHPLTLLMCSPIGDGAAAVLLCSDDYAAKRELESVRVLSSVLLSGRDRTAHEKSVVELASARAYELAGVGPRDLDVLEVHDAAAPAELMIYEELGLCARSDGPRLLSSGETAHGGKQPVNPSGGLLSRGHPIGATGCAQIVELTDQLLGRCGSRQVEGAKLALAENGGGSLGLDAAAAAVTILST